MAEPLDIHSKITRGIYIQPRADPDISG